MHGLLAYDQVIVLLLGALVPIVSYVLNNKARWVSEQVKSVVFVVLPAIVGGVYTALADPNFGWNAPTLNLVATAVAAALLAHHWFYKPGKWNTKLGATETTTVGE